MADKSVDTIVSDVRVCLDEIGINEAELIGGTDSRDMDDIIKSKIPDAIRYVYLNADLALISPSFKSGEAGSDRNGMVAISIDNTFLRLVYAKLEDWAFSATEAIMHTDKRYATLKNPITTGYPDNPKAAICEDDGGVQRTLELYSSAIKGGNVEYIYGYIDNPSMVGDKYNIDDKVYRAVVYHAAGLTLLTFKDAHADAMFNMALTLMGAK